MRAESTQPIAEPLAEPEIERVETFIEDVTRDAREKAKHYLDDTVVPEGGE